MKKENKGFTLIEILIVIAIIGILALVVFVALNPNGRFQDARNSNRVQNVEAIGKALLQYNVDNSGTFPSGIPSLTSTTYSSGFDASGNPQCDYASVTTTLSSTPGCEFADTSNISNALVPKYMTNVPTDTASGGTGYNHYFVALTPDGGHIVVMSDSMEAGVNSNNGPNGTHPQLYFRTF